MPTHPPDFTILMPTRNHARWIEPALRSVLDQDPGERVELIVLDALSDDATPEILERYRDRIVWRRQADRGQADALNQGFPLARGEIVAWLNSDDIYLPGALARVQAAFAADPGLDFVYGDALEIDADGRILTPNLFTEDCVAERFYLSHDYICQPTLFFRRRVLATVGPLRTELRWFLDYEWLTRFFRVGLRGRRLPHFLAANRDHPSTKTNSGGLARWREIMGVLAANPGPCLLRRRCIWIYSLEYVIKGLNAAGWATGEPVPGQRSRRQRVLDSLNRRFMKWVQPRSFDAIVQRYGAEIAPYGPRVEDLWRQAEAPVLSPRAPVSPPPPAPIVPLAPVLEHKYPAVVGELHDALREWLFPHLPLQTGRIDLLTQLLGTGISEAMYLLDRLHAALAAPGDACEFGVAQGATSALIANELRGTGRRLWLYDSFRGLPKPSPQDVLQDDVLHLGSIERYEGEMRCDRAEVEERLRRIGIPPDAVCIRDGFVETTLIEGEGPSPVAFAYVDFDFYEPIRYALEYLDRHLSPGGSIVVDDYNFFSLGAKTAVDEFVARRGADYSFSLPRAFAGRFCLLTRHAAAPAADQVAPVRR